MIPPPWLGSLWRQNRVFEVLWTSNRQNRPQNSNLLVKRHKKAFFLRVAEFRRGSEVPYTAPRAHAGSCRHKPARAYMRRVQQAQNLGSEALLCICVYIHTCMHACVHTCMRACMHAYMHACIHACVHACMHMHACINIQDSRCCALLVSCNCCCGASCTSSEL